MRSSVLHYGGIILGIIGILIAVAPHAGLYMGVNPQGDTLCQVLLGLILLVIGSSLVGYIEERTMHLYDSFNTLLLGEEGRCGPFRTHNFISAPAFHGA
jgi:hypothetical protein